MFLMPLIARGILKPEDMEIVIGIAGKRSPNGTWSEIERHPVLSQKYWEVRETLCKGARWLAMLSQQDQRQFEVVCGQLRNIAAGKTETLSVKPLAVAWRHVERHFRGSGTVGATITRWANPQEMLADSLVEAFLKRTVSRLDPNDWGVQIVHMQYLQEVGYEGIIRLADIPTGYTVWQEEREGYIVNVTNAPAPKSRWITFLLAQKPDAWLMISVWAGKTESRPLTDTHWWADYAFYDIR